MAFSSLPSVKHPSMAPRLALSLGLIMLVVGFIFSAIYFVLSISLFSRLGHEQLEQKGKSAEIIIRQVSDSKAAINSTTYMRQLQAAGFCDVVGVFDAKKHLIDHNVESISRALSRYATDPKLRLREVEAQNKLLVATLAYLKKKPVPALYEHEGLFYTAVANESYSVLVGIALQKPKYLTIAASFLLLCLLGVAINTLFVYYYGSSLAQILAKIVRGLDVDSLRPETIDGRYAELQELIQAVDDKIRQSQGGNAHRSAPAGSPLAEDALQSLQGKLFEKPFPRMQSYELALYPRRPKANTKEFLSGSHDQNHVDVLIGITDSEGVESIITKHRIQERFLVLAKENLSSDAMARNLWNAFFAASELVPGIFFARLDETEKTMDIFRAGNVHLFEVGGETCEEVHLGNEQFGSEYTMVSEHRLKPGSHFVMVSHDAFSAMEVSSADFAAFLSKLGSAKSGKHLLAGILEKIHQKLPAGEVVPGLLAVLSEKK